MNEDIISRETNLINIDPALIRLDTRKNPVSPRSKYDPELYRKFDKDESVIRYSRLALILRFLGAILL